MAFAEELDGDLGVSLARARRLAQMKDKAKARKSRDVGEVSGCRCRCRRCRQSLLWLWRGLFCLVLATVPYNPRRGGGYCPCSDSGATARLRHFVVCRGDVDLLYQVLCNTTGLLLAVSGTVTG